MKIVIPGGTGQVGTVLKRALSAAGHDVVVLSRRPARQGEVHWDGATPGPWAGEIDGSDVVVNLAGRSVSCRYTPANLREMMDSRVDSARVVGEAIAKASRPPRVWLQMSTATVYAHRFDAPNDEATGVIGGAESDAPGYWAYSVDIAKAWEREQETADTPGTRKVALRAAMVMSPDRGGVFDVLLRLAGGVRAVEFLVARDDITGPVNLAAPAPLPQRAFMRALRTAWGVPVGLPATRWMAEAGAFVLRSDTELLLKSRRVVPGRLLEAGFGFDHPGWPEAADDLVRRLRGRGDQRG
jgi:NAD dependent epimerase/dehydratase family enzyme